MTPGLKLGLHRVSLRVERMAMVGGHASGGVKELRGWCTAKEDGVHIHKPADGADDGAKARAALVQKINIRYHCAENYAHRGVMLESPEPTTVAEVRRAPPLPPLLRFLATRPAQ